MKIAFVVGSLDISGGTYVIFQHASYLASRGHDVTLSVVLPYEARMLDWHPAARRLQVVPLEEMRGEFDLAIATWWKTALELHRVKARQYAYFVQSIESRFLDARESALRDLVDSTYELGLPGITEATWIRRYVEEHYGVGYALVPNGIRKDIYTADGSAYHARGTGPGLRVLVEGAMGVPFKNVGRTLKLMRQARVGETWLLTPSGVGSIPGVSRVFSRVPIMETAPVYRSCDVLVKLSYVEGMFGPPLEMFHCGGTAIVYEVTGHDEYIEHDRNALVIPSGDEDGVIAAIRGLQRDPDHLRDLQAGAMQTAERWPGWATSSAMFEEALGAIMAAAAVDRQELEARNTAARQAYEDRAIRNAATRTRGLLGSTIRARLHRLPERVRSPFRHLAYILETR